MKRKFDNKSQNSMGRLIFAAVCLLVQIGWLLLMLLYFDRATAWSGAALNILAVILVLRIVNKETNAAFKLPWVIVILIIPVGGILLYIIAGRSGITKKRGEKLDAIGDRLREEFLTGNLPLDEEEEQKLKYAGQVRYIRHDSAYPAYDDSAVKYYGNTLFALDAMLHELSKAEKFIFMEYHAIEDAEAFGRIRAVLADRAEHGVTVRIIYDDMGSVGFINPGFIKRLAADGIECRVFNPIMPVINVFMNNRDHRKITVIDGRTGFTGGFNLADEYFNIVKPYGEWKDSGVMIKGNAVRNLTVQFLEMWNSIKNTDTDYARFFPENPRMENAQGTVQPYGDCPLDDVYLGENVYMNMISSAKDYIWFTTPYLIITDEMIRTLSLASLKGVDVRIITPGIPDKKFVYSITRSYYHQLVKNGVRIYEFTPGFMHAKQCVCDDTKAVAGTINLDYRSLYFHFENAVFFADCEAVSDVKADFINTFKRCREVTEMYRRRPKETSRLKNRIMKLFSPLF